MSGNTWPSEYPEIGNGTVAYYERGNDGSNWENAYILESSEDLYIMRERVEAGSEDAGKYYKLSSDIEFHVKNRQHIRGNYWGEAFTGHFDGQNHTVNLDTDESLFYVVSPDEGTVAVRNLKIAGSVNGAVYSNSALAWRLNSGTIENCSFIGSISSNNSSSSGLVADLRGGTILNCTVSADISNAYSNGNAGGIVGYLTSGTIESCSVQAGTVITSPQYAGGIAGYSASNLSTGIIRNCNVEEGTVITSKYEGGVLGYSEAIVTLSGNAFPSGYQEIGNKAANPVPSQPAANLPYYSRGNDGASWETAYVIASSQDLVLMRDRVNDGTDGSGKYYKLSADIDLTSLSDWQGIGYGRDFTGHFDGQGHTVILSSDSGLFGEINTDFKDTTAVRNLEIVGKIESSGYCGAIVKELYSGIIENCRFTGRIYNHSVNADTGGIVGWLHGGIVRGCSVNADLFSDTTDPAYSTGGIAGYVGSSSGQVSIENCILEAGSNIIASSDAGGIVGLAVSKTDIKNCTIQSGVKIVASADAGGIAGEISEGTVTNCTVEDGVSITGSRAGGITGLTDSSEVTFSGNKWPSSYSESGSDYSGIDPGSQDNTPNITPQITWNKHKYQVFNENITWEEAKSRCESLGGHLVTITSTLEQAQVENLMRQSRTDFPSYWIGAKADGKGWWNWVTDEVFEKQYANFASGQPDGSGNYLCLYWNTNGANVSGSVADTVSNSGKWDDVTANGSDTGITSRGFICEWDEEQEAIEEAPSAADFKRWQENPDAWRGDSESGVPSGANPSPVDTSHLSQKPPNAEMTTLPVSYDARQKNSLPPARNQGIFETCWAFASLGAMEADYMIKGFTSLGESPDLSELHLAWFTYKDPSSDSFVASKRYFIDKTPSSFLMKGGDPDKAISFLNKVTFSPVNESEMPYAEAGEVASDADTKIIAFLNGRTSGSFSKADISLSDVNNIGSISAGDTENTNRIKSQIMEHGAVYFRYGNDERGYNNDKTSFYYDNKGDSPHAALLVGWDDNYPAENFRQNPGVNGAWLVRTSQWNDKDTGEPIKVGDNEYGCFWMSYAQAGTESGMTEIRSFSVREEKANVRENGSGVHTKDITSAWGARIFRVGRNERLIRISFHTTDNNVKYKVFVNRFGKKIPTDPGRAENPLSEGEIAYAGYHTITLSSPVDLYDGDYYAVIIKMTMFATSNYSYPTAVEASIDKYLEVSANEGESFFAEGDEVPSVWQDGTSVDGGPYNACIITFTEERITYDTEPAITTASLPSATVNEYYTFALSSSGTQKIEWRSGNIPEDFALSREGVLTGNPTKAGQYDINLTALNDVGYVEKTLALTVNSAANKDNTSEPINDTPKNDTPEDNKPVNDDTLSDDIPADNESYDSTATGVGSSGGGCNSGLYVCAAVLLLLLSAKRDRG